MFNFVRINAMLVAGIDLTKASHFKTNKRQAQATSSSDKLKRQATSEKE
jgi:hypothetical protein